MAMTSVPKDLDRVNKSLEWFGQPTGCLCDCVIAMRKITCLHDVVGGSKTDCRIVP